MSEAYTKEEMQKMFLDSCRTIARVWSMQENISPKEMCDGVVFSILNIIDGGYGGFPASIDLVMAPHPEDKEYHLSNDENYIEPGQVINDCALHELYYRKEEL